MKLHSRKSLNDFTLIRDNNKKLFLDVIDACNGSKAIIWDDALAGAFGLFAEWSLLQDHNVKRMFYLPKSCPDEYKLPTTSVQSILFVIRPVVALVQAILCGLAREDGAEILSKDYHIAFVPEKCTHCEHVIKASGFISTFTSITSLRVHTFPLDLDLLSMHNDTTLRNFYVEKDQVTPVYQICQALLSLQKIFGVIPHITGKGEIGKKVAELFLKYSSQELGHCSATYGNEHNSPLSYGSINTLILIDRSVDYLTPLLTQLTYEGLIDEIYGIKNNQSKVDINTLLNDEKMDSSNQTSFTPSQAEASSNSSQSVKMLSLCSKDSIYANIRDRNFNAVPPVLNATIKSLSQDFEERKQAKSVAEVKAFVAKLPELSARKQSLSRFTKLTEAMKSYVAQDEFKEGLGIQQQLLFRINTDCFHPRIDEMLTKGEAISEVLRLICLQCFVNDGLKVTLLQSYIREVVHVYGFKHFLTMQNLIKCHILHDDITSSSSSSTNPISQSSASKKKSFSAKCKLLKLIVENTNEKQPNDISYTFSMYAPLSIRVMQALPPTCPTISPENNPNSSGSKLLQSLLPEHPLFHYTQSLSSFLIRSSLVQFPKSPLALPFLKTQESTVVFGSSHSYSSSMSSRYTTPTQNPNQDPMRSDLSSKSDAEGSVPVFLIFFVGGLTYAEVSAIRFIASHEDPDSVYLVACDHMINSKTLLKAISQELVSPFDTRQQGDDDG